MAKLHELLAVDGNLKGQADKARTDLAQTFEKKRHLFTEKVVTFTAVDEGSQSVTEEQLDLNTTVKKELRWFKPILANALDVQFQIAEANTQARGNVMVDGQPLIAAVPATALLEMEKRLNEVHSFVASIPTLDPAKGFSPDVAKGKDIFRARDARTVRTRKVVKPLVLAPATDKHPAQVQVISVDEKAGDILTQEWSGLITVAEKADMLERCEKLQRAVKQARARANQIDVSTNKVGDALLGFVFGV